MAQHTRELFGNLVRREVRGRYKGSWMGVVWTLVNPLVGMVVYTLVFTVLWPTNLVEHHYPVFLLVGQAFWLFFSGAVMVAASSLIGNADLVKKVNFPRQIVPLAAVVSQGIPAAVMLVLLVPIGAIVMRGDHRVMLLLPWVVLCCIALVTGIALAISVVNVYFRDAEHILTALLLPWFFLTPILYPWKAFPLHGSKAWVADLIEVLNFPTPFVLALQDTLFFGAWPSYKILAYITIVGFGALAGGWWVFQRMQRNLAVEL